VPSRYRALFRDQEAVLKTHRGSDLGALWLARELATALEAPLFAGSVSRLLIDLNRSLHHVKLFRDHAGLSRERPAEARRIRSGRSTGLLGSPARQLGSVPGPGLLSCRRRVPGPAFRTWQRFGYWFPASSPYRVSTEPSPTIATAGPTASPTISPPRSPRAGAEIVRADRGRTPPSVRPAFAISTACDSMPVVHR
jgi:hypothetical protein